MFSDGPFVESKGYLASLWVWEAPTWMWRALATDASKVCDRRIDVRLFL